MSLIADALKTAQRERQRRATETAAADPSPLLVPLRANQPTFSWVTALSIGVAGAALVAIVVVAAMLSKAAPRTPLPSVPASASSELMPGAGNVARKSASATASNLEPDSSILSAPLSAPLSRPAAPPRTQASPFAVPVSRAPEVPRQVIAPTPQPSSERASGRELRITVDDAGRTDAGRLFAQGVAAQRSGDLMEARRIYERLLSITPNDADLLNNLGVLLTSQHNARAIDMLQRAVSLAPANPSAWTNLGLALRDQSRPTDAMAAFQRALALDSGRKSAKVNLAQLYLAAGELSRALEIVDGLLSGDPGSPEGHYVRGQVLEMRGDRNGAVREYREFLRLATPALAPYAERVRGHLDTLSLRATP